MGRALLVATLLCLSSPAAFAQALNTLQITVTLADATGTLTPVARHALLISEEPPNAAPRRVLTTLAGTATITLRPGRYAVQSDQPLAFEGKTYEWSQRIDIVSGRDATLELTAGNASIETGTASVAGAGTDLSVLASQWEDTVVALWTPTQHASGFVVDARGLIVTNQRVVGTATSVEVNVTPDVRVKATVLASDVDRDVAILWVHPSVVASVRPLPPGCGETRPPVVNGQELYAFGAPMVGEKRLSSGDVTGVGPRLILSDLTVARGTSGGPVFAAGGLIGFTAEEDRDPGGRSDSRVVRIAQVCEVITSAEQRMAGATPPDATHLPREREPVAVSALAAAMKGRAGSLNPYLTTTANFDVAFLTPVHVYGTENQPRGAVIDFGHWSEYLADHPRVLLVRVTPKMKEGLWAKVARGAAMTQGMSLPPMKRATSGFSRLRAFCGDTEVTPIHPFLIEQRLSASEAIYEGLYVFDPASLGPHCNTVTLTVYSEKEPDKGDTRVVDPKVLQQITRDFAAL